jgi:hypothetical protein
MGGNGKNISSATTIARCSILSPLSAAEKKKSQPPCGLDRRFIESCATRLSRETRDSGLSVTPSLALWLLTTVVDF